MIMIKSTQQPMHFIISQSYLLTYPKHPLMGRLFKCPWGFLFSFWRLRLGAYWSGDMLLICFCLTLASCFVFLNCSVSLIVFVRSVYWLVPRPFSRLSVEVATSSPGSSSAWPCRAQQGREDRGNEVVLVAAQVLTITWIIAKRKRLWKGSPWKVYKQASLCSFVP